MRHYFLTGGTGVVGSAFLQRIAARQERATLLLRADTPRQADERLRELLAYCAVAPEAGRKIDAVAGDLYRPGLGLVEPAYARVADQCTHLVHCAGNVHMNLPLAEARRQTLAMTTGILALLEASRAARKLEFVSTVGVAGHTAGEIPEQWLDHARAFRNSYEAAKAEAEMLLREKITAGRPITVHRPSMVVGDSRSGKTSGFQVFYYLCEFLSGARSYGFLPHMDGMRLDIVPADYVAAVLDWSAAQEARPATILHLCSGKEGALPLKAMIGEVRRVFSRYGRRLPAVKMLPLPLFNMLLRLVRPLIAPKERRALDALPFFFAYLKETQYFGNSATRALLGADNIDLPKVEDYFENVLGYYLTAKGHGSKKA
ncbi:MAG: SDR family oxidoreductase [Desulfatitalea sp.]